MQEIIAQITHLARQSPSISQNSGVSVRVSIADYKTMLSNATRRAVTLGEDSAVPRISDLPHIHASIASKIELEGYEAKEDKVINELIDQAVLAIFKSYFKPETVEALAAEFGGGLTVDASDMLPADGYLPAVGTLRGLQGAVRQLGVPEDAAGTASAVEFVLEGLYLSHRLKKSEVRSKRTYGR
jgi:magnesium chelatase subunit I